MPVSCLSLCASFNLFQEFSPMIIVIAFAQISPLTAAGAPLCEERLRSGKHCVLSLSYYFQSVACFVLTLICALQIKISAVTLSSACKLAKRRHRAMCRQRAEPPTESRASSLLFSLLLLHGAAAANFFSCVF